MDQQNANTEKETSAKRRLPYLGLFESSGVVLLVGTGLFFVQSPWAEWILALGVLVGFYGFIQLIHDGDFWKDEPDHDLTHRKTKSLTAKRMRILAGVYLGAASAFFLLGAFVSQWDDGATLMLSPLLSLFLLVADVVVIAQKSKWPSISRRSSTFFEGGLRGFGMASFYAFSLAIVGISGMGVASGLGESIRPKPQPAFPLQKEIGKDASLIEEQKTQAGELPTPSGTSNVDYWSATVKRLPTTINTEHDSSVPSFLKNADLRSVRSVVGTDKDVDDKLRDLAIRFLANVTEYRRLIDPPEPTRSTMENLAIETSREAATAAILPNLPPPSFSRGKQPKVEPRETRRLDDLAAKIFATMTSSVSGRTKTDQHAEEIERLQARLWLNLLEAYELRGRMKSQYPHQRFLFPWEAEE